MLKIGIFKSSQSIISKNTCKTCALGMGGQAGGMVNELGSFPEICKKSFQAQLSDIQGGIPASYFLKNQISEIQKLTYRDCERLGRLTFPLYKKEGDAHYRILDWQTAMEILIQRMRGQNPERSFFYSSGRSSNEAAFLLQLFARLWGCAHIHNCSYYCHQASGTALQGMIGSATATIQLSDLKNSDCIFIIGANPASNHPRLMKELIRCRRRGGKVIVINPLREAGLEKFAVPSDWRSLLSFGSNVASDYFQIRIGSDVAVLKALAKFILENSAEDREFIRNHTDYFEAFRHDVLNAEWEELLNESGLSKEEIERCARHLLQAKQVVFAWAMGITHHRHGVENVEMISNLALLTGMIGKQGAGLLPLRGHSNVQGIGSMGFTPQLKEEIRNHFEKNLNISFDKKIGYDTMACMNAADRGEMDFAFFLGGNLYASNPDLSFAENALNNIPFKVFLSTTLNSGHLHGVNKEVLILPVRTRDEEKSPCTQESMFNFVRLSNGGINRFENCRAEMDIIRELAKELLPKTPFDFTVFDDIKTIRQRIAEVIPGYEKLADIDKNKEEFHITGRHIRQEQFPTHNGKACFKVVPLPKWEQKRQFRLMSIRSEGQFNSIVYDEQDCYRHKAGRFQILMNEQDMKDLNLHSGEQVRLRSDIGESTAFSVIPFPIKEKNLAAYYPEINCLIPRDIDPRSKTPSFKHIAMDIEKII